MDVIDWLFLYELCLLLDEHSSGPKWFLSCLFELVLSVFNLILFPLVHFVVVTPNFK